MKISAVLITLNEEGNIADCLKTLSWADEIVVMDGESSDRTPEIARRFTPRVFSHPFTDFSSQKNAAAGKAEGDWIFFIDADERVTPELAEEIKKIAAGDSAAVYAVHRHTFFFGKRMRFSGTRSDWPVRLFPRNAASFTQPVHEEVVSALPVLRLQNVLLHYSTRDLAHYRRKLDCYIPFEIQVMKQKGRPALRLDRYRIPILKFFYLYILKLGILDGLAGLQFSFLSSYYDYLKYKKYYQFVKFDRNQYDHSS